MIYEVVTLAFLVAFLLVANYYLGYRLKKIVDQLENCNERIRQQRKEIVRLQAEATLQRTRADELGKAFLSMDGVTTYSVITDVHQDATDDPWNFAKVDLR